MIDNAAHFAVETIVISCFPMAVGVNHLLRPRTSGPYLVKPLSVSPILVGG